MKLAFIIDPIAKLDPGHDSTVAMMEAAQILGHEVWITEVHQLSVIDGKALAILSQVQLVPVTLKEGKWLSVPQWYELSSPELRCLEDMDAVFMRKDPPVTIRYLYATYILELINPEKTLVINSPQGLREANEKMYTLQFYSVMPETVVSQDKDIIRRFVEEKNKLCLNPWEEKQEKEFYF
ncbi:Glutathione synthetase [Crocosphaera watsonii WH 8502]|uniref:Glutathione synthetase n=2 Tax=Crocosphaera watsonii TaxID=263511 RepID=T2J384_CROWT|nr:Glutathione synthetase [Crocosphaera watsonii WH 8502]CCQ60313.1 Glutathione synthetase [Crocosphaera watsonii WH 0401]